MFQNDEAPDRSSLDDGFFPSSQAYIVNDDCSPADVVALLLTEYANAFTASWEGI